LEEYFFKAKILFELGAIEMKTEAVSFLLENIFALFVMPVCVGV